MEVIGADGVRVGTVDRVEGSRIKLTRDGCGEPRGPPPLWRAGRSSSPASRATRPCHVGRRGQCRTVRTGRGRQDPSSQRLQRRLSAPRYPRQKESAMTERHFHRLPPPFRLAIHLSRLDHRALHQPRRRHRRRHQARATLAKRDIEVIVQDHDMQEETVWRHVGIGAAAYDVSAIHWVTPGMTSGVMCPTEERRPPPSPSP